MSAGKKGRRNGGNIAELIANRTGNRKDTDGCWRLVRALLPLALHSPPQHQEKKEENMCCGWKVMPGWLSMDPPLPRVQI